MRKLPSRPERTITFGLPTNLPVASRFWDGECNRDFSPTVDFELEFGFESLV